MTSLTPTTRQVEELAATLGDEVYIDVARWHLYLREAKLHLPLAEQLAPLVLANQIQESAVAPILKQILIKIGGGRHELPLADLLPMQSLLNLLDVLEKTAQQWAR